MSQKGNKYMWVFLFFDLPAVSSDEKRQAAKFRNLLLKEGFIMIQWSVYARVCNGDERVRKHLNHLRDHLPPEGHIRTLTVTEKQYAAMELLLGNKKPTEKTGCEQLLLL